MPHYFFDIKDGHRLVDPSGSDCKNDTAAIEKARVLAIGVSLDKPAVDPTRRISVLNADRHEISTVPVYSKPSLRSWIATVKRSIVLQSHFSHMPSKSVCWENVH
jgi:hypothetical protein